MKRASFNKPKELLGGWSSRDDMEALHTLLLPYSRASFPSGCA